MFAVRADLVSFVAVARVRSFGVDAVAVLAQVAVGRTLVDVAAVVRHAHLMVSFRTDAHERSDEVFARELAVVGRRGALVDVYVHKNGENQHQCMYQCINVYLP